ncbi:MAG: serine O-acetyltransferase [Betaproteobacteria bacterium]
MIHTRADLKRYLEADKRALRITKRSPSLVGDRVWKFQRALRSCEYYRNTGRRLRYYWHKLRLERLSAQTGFSIPLNVFGPGLSIAHAGTIVVHRNARIGANCRIHVCVNIGASRGSDVAPRLGDNVYIAPGAKIFGDIEIASDIAIGANAVVNKSFLEPGITIAGVPAAKISARDSRGLALRAA